MFLDVDGGRWRNTQQRERERGSLRGRKRERVSERERELESESERPRKRERESEEQRKKKRGSERSRERDRECKRERNRRVPEQSGGLAARRRPGHPGGIRAGKCTWGPRTVPSPDDARSSQWLLHIIGLVFKAHRHLYHSALGSRVVKKKKKDTSWTSITLQASLCSSRPQAQEVKACDIWCV